MPPYLKNLYFEIHHFNIRQEFSLCLRYDLGLYDSDKLIHCRVNHHQVSDTPIHKIQILIVKENLHHGARATV